MNYSKSHQCRRIELAIACAKSIKDALPGHLMVSEANHALDDIDDDVDACIGKMTRALELMRAGGVARAA